MPSILRFAEPHKMFKTLGSEPDDLIFRPYDLRSRPSAATASPPKSSKLPGLSMASHTKTEDQSQVAKVKFRASKKKLDAAESYLDDRLRKMEEEFDDEADLAGPGFVIAENVTLESFLRYVDNEPKLRVKLRLVSGKVMAYELTSGIHSDTTGAVLLGIAGATQHLPPASQLKLATGPNVFVGPPNSLLIPDGAIIPRGRPMPPAGQGRDAEGKPYPTLVIEVGFTESLQSLHELAADFFSPRTTIRLYLAIKIFSRRVNGTRPMLALLYRRPNPVPANPLPSIVKSFGTAPLSSQSLAYLRSQGIAANAITGYGNPGAPSCNAVGIPQYQVPLPTAELFNGVPGGVPAGMPANIMLDLYMVHGRALQS